MQPLNFFEKVLNSINLMIEKQPNIPIVVLSFGFVMFMMIFMFLILKEIINHVG